jgi:pSer/pThr/pTyr-binding forkhead associated (FHA) protein
LGSTNGTSLNDKPISGSQPLRDGDLIGVGKNLLLFQLQGNEPATPQSPSTDKEDTDVRLPTTVSTETPDLH